MPQPGESEARTLLVRSFSTLEEASAAQDALAAAGIPRELASLSVRTDEAGPVEGNFLIGNGETTHGGPPDAVRTGLEVPYDENFREPAYRGAYLLTLQLGPTQRSVAEGVLARFDAVSASELADAGARS